MSTVGGGMCSACWRMALVSAIYIVFLIKYIFPFFYISCLNLVLKRQTEGSGQWYQHLLTLWVIFFKISTKGTNFWLLVSNVVYMYVCFVWFFSQS